MTLKEIIGHVTSNKMSKTVTVAVSRKVKHKRYSKIVIKTKKYYAHDEHEQYQVGDRVKIQQTRPISKFKSWEVIEIISKNNL